MMHISDDLGKTATYSRREYVCLAGLGWPDGRDATCWFQHIKAKRRRNSKATVSRYGVSEVKEVAYIGRAFVWDKEMGEGEHGVEPGHLQRSRLGEVDEVRAAPGQASGEPLGHQAVAAAHERGGLGVEHGDAALELEHAGRAHHRLNHSAIRGKISVAA